MSNGKPKIRNIKKDYAGTQLPPTQHGKAGVGFENILKADGFKIDSLASGPDIPEYNLEVKTRNISATSAHTIGCINPNDIKLLSWEETTLHDKFQQQFRAITDESNYQQNTIVKCKVYDFSEISIQTLVKEAYEICRGKIMQGNTKQYIYGSKWGYMERKQDSNSYQFRISHSAFKKLEAMAESSEAFITMFEYKG